MATETAKNASGTPFSFEKPLPPGRAGQAASKPVVLATEDFAALGATNETAPANDTAAAGLNGRLQRIAQLLTALTNLATEYEAVGAGVSDQPLGASGAAGDRLVTLIIQPGTTSPGSVVLKDGGATIFTFPGGAGSVATLHPIPVSFNLKSVGALTVSTGANVSVLAIGDFT